ncbi:adenylosuccinate synthase [Owenweeksia hongkongensis]|uniref:Adenylosuccinate synthetase n=1 Tax=Owenweeksia hongkongensis (strain DSM 17368 / CIP 108786 / JCM 12287 / NRRL B-23963 / UST20020801) TaxID=926562 RepID=G8R8I4_OWEHD|nr:adenylosuccinate synthase [Owenweeksia hongkongensis]AEV31366.1 adenylosuccinate synthase [Owenweeksia hongkongensis DSM 17368]
MAVDVLLGLQWGDEGKGKIVDVLTRNYDIIARFQGGPNAGHTLEFEGHKHVLHTIPSGVFHPESSNVIGNGVVIDPVIFKKEIDNLKVHNVDVNKVLKISRKAHLILPSHRLLDAASEAAKGKNKIGSTLKGIGPTYMDKTGRNGLRVGDIEQDDFKERYDALVAKHEQILMHYTDFEYDLKSIEDEWFAAIDFLRSLTLIDSEHFMHKSLREGKTILAEGAQGSLLDIDFGSYPFVTSSTTTCAGSCTGLGIAPNKIRKVFGIFKAYCTRVGSGPFPTELFDETGKELRAKGNEFGATTGRERRCGWLDLPALKYAIDVNGVTNLIMMKSDVLSGFPTIKVCTAYRYKGTEIDYLPYRTDENLVEPIYTELPGWNEDITKLENFDDAPQNLKDYVAYLQEELGVPITIVSVGPDRKQTIVLEETAASV